MARPLKCRFITQEPQIDYFKPRGIPLTELEEVTLTLDELEAVRLADLNGAYQEQAARQMQVSRATFGNILSRAHRKIAAALVNGKAIRIEGGVYNMRKRNRLRQRRSGRSVQEQTENRATVTENINDNPSKTQDLRPRGKTRARCGHYLRRTQ